MVSKFWLYLGIILACSGIGTGVGIFLIILYVWGDIREAIDNNNVTSNTAEEEMYNANHYDDETIDEMK
jgi:hypothetical protein